MTTAAVAQYIGQESLIEPDNEAVATVAQESKRLIGIYSTHSDESYIPTDGAESKEKDAGIYDVDEALKKALEERGIEVELDTTTHLPHDAGAYRRSRSTAARPLSASMPAAAKSSSSGILSRVPTILSSWRSSLRACFIRRPMASAAPPPMV